MASIPVALVVIGCSSTPSTHVTVGPSGGTVSSPDQTLTIDIPPGALTESVTVTVSPATNVPTGALGPAFEIGPTGTTFAVPIALSFRFDPALLASPDDELEVSTVVSGQWAPLPAVTFDARAHVVGGLTDHLSPYAPTRSPKHQNPAAPCDCDPRAFDQCCKSSGGTVQSATPRWCWCLASSLATFASLYDCYYADVGEHLVSGCAGDFASCCAKNGGALWPYRPDICICNTFASDSTIRCWRNLVVRGEALGRGNEQVMCTPVPDMAVAPDMAAWGDMAGSCRAGGAPCNKGSDCCGGVCAVGGRCACTADSCPNGCCDASTGACVPLCGICNANTGGPQLCVSPGNCNVSAGCGQTGLPCCAPNLGTCPCSAKHTCNNGTCE